MERAKFGEFLLIQIHFMAVFRRYRQPTIGAFWQMVVSPEGVRLLVFRHQVLLKSMDQAQQINQKVFMS